MNWTLSNFTGSKNSNNYQITAEQVMSIVKRLLTFTNSIVIPITILFNVLSIVVCWRNVLSKTTNIWFHYTLVSATNIVLVILGTLQYTSIDDDYNILVTNSFSCICVSYLTRLFLQFSSWLNVIFTYEYTILVRRPQFHKKYLNNKKNLCLIIASLFTFLCIINCLNFRLKLVDKNLIYLSLNISLAVNETASNMYLCTAEQNILFIRDMISQAFRLFIPFVLMVIGNAMLIRKLKRSKKKSCRVGGQSKKELDFIYVILGLNVLFFVSLVPTTTTIVMLNFYNYGNTNMFRSNSIEIAYVKFANIISAVISTYNYVFPFLINLKFNNLFYQRFVYLFCSKRTLFCCKNRSQIKQKFFSQILYLKKSSSNVS